MRMTPLSESDNLTVREWAIDYLSRYVRARSRAYGLDGLEDDAAVTAHIEKHDLDGALWHDLVHADYSEGEFVAVARKGNEPLGMVLVRERQDPYLRVPLGVIQWIYVAPKHRRGGVAKALLEEASSWMKRRGIQALETSLGARDEAARALYEREGFAVTEAVLAGSR